MNEAIHYVWDSEVSLAAVRFGNRLTPDGARLVSSFQQLLSKHRPEFRKVVWEFVDRDAIGARGSAVGSDSCPGTFEVVGVDNLFHEVLWNSVQGWLLDGRRARVTGKGLPRARAFHVFRSLLVAGMRFCVFGSVRIHRWFFLVKKRSVLSVAAGLRQIGTMTSADFSEHESGHPGRPAFRASPTRGYASEISPNKGRELSLREYAIYSGGCRKRVLQSSGRSPQ
ncbi:hypothetical protein Pla52n_67080 [Stieleria varia]|uniref:Uncharacterized protein n=1 Tax=Stieleria varia TaxID=2528005 RepID=A0A5C5ZU04_9BACT|nr:hypothetical protein Pla52n_67080 [Stieleria varia]